MNENSFCSKTHIDSCKSKVILNKYSMRKIDLQFFASSDGKTEKATSKKRQDARKKGQVLQSKELSAAIVLVAVFVSLGIFGNNICFQIELFTKKLFTEYVKYEDLFTVIVIRNLFSEIALVLFKIIAPIFAIALVTGLLVAYAQVGFLFTVETLGLKFNRINPLSGFKRLFSLHAVTELVKAILKIAVIGFIAYLYLNGEKRNIVNTINLEVMDIAMYIGSTSISLAIRICVALIFLSIIDYGYQWWEYEKNLRMSKQDIKEEYKQIEGNPEIKSKIKQKQRQISMRRMMTQVPKADVIITNPTHYAIAIKYDADVSAAPVLTAKGQDFIALRIKEVAREHGVEIVENKPLARTLYDTVEIGQSIPPELFQAVAEVLAFVYSLKEKGVRN